MRPDLRDLKVNQKNKAIKKMLSVVVICTIYSQFDLLFGFLPAIYRFESNVS